MSDNTATILRSDEPTWFDMDARDACRNTCPVCDGDLTYVPSRLYDEGHYVQVNVMCPHCHADLWFQHYLTGCMVHPPVLSRFVVSWPMPDDGPWCTNLAEAADARSVAERYGKKYGTSSVIVREAAPGEWDALKGRGCPVVKL